MRSAAVPSAPLYCGVAGLLASKKEKSLSAFVPAVWKALTAFLCDPAILLPSGTLETACCSLLFEIMSLTSLEGFESPSTVFEQYN